MTENRDSQAMFMAALESIKEYAKVNGQIVSEDDVHEHFKGLELDEAKMNMVYGYLMANNIKVSGETSIDNEFLAMMEQAAQEDNSSEDTYIDTMTEEDYKNDEKYLEMYINDLKEIEELTDTTRAFLLMNIVEDKDKDSLQLLSQSFLKKIAEWIEPFRRKGVLSSDLIQEANLAMMAYVSEQRFLNNLEWKDKIKEGTTQDLLEVLKGIEKEVCDEVKGCLNMLLDEQRNANKVNGKVLNKVNLVNDWAVRLKEELGRKPTADEVAEKMGISKENVLEAIKLSAEKIEDISI